MYEDLLINVNVGPTNKFGGNSYFDIYILKLYVQNIFNMQANLVLFRKSFKNNFFIEMCCTFEKNSKRLCCLFIIVER